MKSPPRKLSHQESARKGPQGPPALKRPQSGTALRTSARTSGRGDHGSGEGGLFSFMGRSQDHSAGRERVIGSPAMKILSVNVGLPRPAVWKGRRIMTGIFKEPVAGRVRVRRHNLDGDGQADLSVHGGPEKAVYAYPSEHYPFWRRELELAELPWGAFGENLTTEGWWEDEVHVGDRFRIGTAELVVTQPRMPCFKP